MESGIETFDIDLKEQKVTVKGNVKPEDVFQTVSKSGKKTSYWEGEATAPDASAPAAAEAAPNTAAEAPADAAAAVPEITPAKADAWSSHYYSHVMLRFLNLNLEIAGGNESWWG